MTREESLTIVEIVASGWPDAKTLDRDEINLYARSIEDLDAELTTHAVLRAVKDTPYRLRVSELRERVRMEKRRLVAEVSPLDEPERRPVPIWVKRWICARLLHQKFDKEFDQRRFREQGEFGDLTQEMMPDGAWIAEAEKIGDKDFSLVFQMLK